MTQERHFYTDMDAAVTEVEIGDYEAANRSDEIYTEGLGPCIGVAFSFELSGYVFHGGGMQHTQEFDDFLSRASEFLNANERSKIRPVVAGGGATDLVGDDVVHSRNYCLSRLREMGFGPPHVCWCPDRHTQSLYLDVHHNKVRVHTENMVVSSIGESVDIDCE